MLAKLLYGYKATQCLYVAAKLNIADHLLSGKKNIHDLARTTNTNCDALYRVMRCLAALGVFNEESEKIFSLNSAADDLLSDSENTMKDFIILCGEELYRSAGDLLYSVKTDLPAFDHIYGMNHWDYLEKHPDKAKTFHDAMEKGSLPMIKDILKHYDFSTYKSIVDVGGGKGQLICEILSQYPHTNGIVFDLPNAEKFAENYIISKNLSDRCKFISGSFFEATPKDSDLYLLKVVLHDWDDKKALQILQKCRESISKTGKILIIEKIIENNNFKDLACLGDINMLVTLKGRERSLDEFKHLLDIGGFKLLQKIGTNTVFSIIEAESI